MTRRLRAALGAALVAIACVACGGERAWRPPDVVLISLDTLRADHLPTYGYAKPTAPRLDALARESLVFDRAYTEAPHTLPSHTSLFTGLHPGRHGVRDRGDTLAPDVPTLAELFAAQGYQTGGFTNCYFLTPEFRIERGFSHYDAAHDIESPRAADATNDAVFAWLDTLAPDRPLFLFTHYFDVHSDWDVLAYDAAEEYRKRFAGDPPPGFRNGDGKVAATRWLAKLNREGAKLTPEELTYLRGLYDAGVAWTDAQLGALLDGLEARGRLRDAIVIVTADHGEEFLEHGKFLHTQVFEESMRIPLLVSLPEMRGAAGPSCRPRTGLATPVAGRTDALVQHVDMLPTLAECLGFPLPAGVQGTSFRDVLAGGRNAREAVYFDTPRGTQIGVMRGGWKLVESTASGRRRLYRLDRDPGERSDLAKQEPERVAALAAELARHRAENEAGRVAGERVEVPDEVHEALEALGYVREDEKR